MAYLEDQTRGVLKEIEDINAGFKAWNQQQADRIQELMRAAGILEEVNAIETSRKENHAKAQEQIDVLKGKIADIQRIRAFLAHREQTDVPVVEREPPKKSKAAPEPPSPMNMQDPLGLGSPRVLSEMEVLTGKPGQGE